MFWFRLQRSSIGHELAGMLPHGWSAQKLFARSHQHASIGHASIVLNDAQARILQVMFFTAQRFSGHLSME